MANAISHDQNFKNLILDYPRESLAFFAAEEAPSAADEVRIVPARVNLANMNSPADHRIPVYAAAVGGLLELEPDPDRRAKYLEFIDMYAALTDNEYRRYGRLYPEESNTMAGVIQRARDEGMQQGRVEGMQQGRVEGERAVLERQLRRRFGLLPPATASRLDRASTADLETWAENVLDAETLDDVFGQRS